MAYPTFPVLSFTTASVPAQSSLEIDQALGVNRCLILKIAITPSEADTNNRFELYQKDTFLLADLIYGTIDFDGDLIDPMEEKGLGPTERTLGLACFYKDADSSNELHLKTYNNHTQAQTYDVDVTYLPLLRPVAGTGVAISGDDDTEARMFSTPANQTVQKVAVRKNSAGGDIGTRRRFNFIEGANIVLTIADDAGDDELDVTIAGAGAANKVRLLSFPDIAELVDGGPVQDLHDFKAVIGLPDDADSEIEVSFRVPDDFVTGSAAFLVLNFAPKVAPGVTNNKVKLDMEWKVNSGSFSTATSKTLTLADDALWDEDTSSAGENEIPASSVSVGDLVSVRIKRDVSVANNAAVQFQIGFYGLEYTSQQ